MSEFFLPFFCPKKVGNCFDLLNSADSPTILPLRDYSQDDGYKIEWKSDPAINPDAEIVAKLTETVEEIMLRLTGVDLSLCPECGKGKMVHIEDLPNLLLDTS